MVSVFSMDYLSQLPGELIDEICTYLLEKEDLQSLRLCNRRLKDESARAFDDRRLGLVRVMWTRQSFLKLIELAQNERFQKAIKELEIYTVSFSNTSRAPIDGVPRTPQEFKEIKDIIAELNLMPIDDEGIKTMLRGSRLDRAKLPPQNPEITQFRRDLKLKRRRLHDRQKHDQHTMRTSSIDVELLAEAFRNLPALKCIRTTDSFDMGNPPLAARELFNEIGVGATAINTPQLRFLKVHVVAVVFGALLRSACQPELLGFQEIPDFLPLAKTPSSRKFSRRSTPAMTLARNQLAELNFSKLRSFSIVVSNRDYGPHWNLPKEEKLQWMIALLKQMPSLRKLSIRDINYQQKPDLMHMLATSDISFPKLHTLEVKDFGFQLTDLKALFRKLEPTLKRFTCFGGWLLDEKSDKILGALGHLPLLIFAEIYTRTPYMGAHQRRTIQGRTPDAFQKELSEALSYCSEKR